MCHTPLTPPSENAYMPHVLIVEDDHDIATVLQHDLQHAGYHTTHADSVMQGLTLAREHNPGLVLLTVPDGTGRDVLLHLKSTTGERTIVLTARDAIDEKVELLNLGASDYIVKPYNLGELLTRVAVQLRVPVSDLLIIGDLFLSPSEQLVRYQGKELRFTPTEFDILTLKCV